MPRPPASLREAARPVLVVLAWGVLLAVLSYRARELVPSPGLDPSWQAGLHLGARLGLDWGPDLDFTYGPLGYLAVPQLFYDRQAVAALIWTEGLRALALGLVFVRARRTLGGVPAFGVVLLLGSTLAAPVVVAGATIAFVVAVRDARHPQVRALLGAVAALSAFAVLVKTSEGVAVGALAALAAATGPGTRRERLEDLGLLAGSFLVAFLAVWLAIGQALDALPAYVSATIAVVGGYAEAMQTDPPERVGTYSLALLLIVAGAAVAWRLDTVVGSRARAAAVALWLGVCWLQFKAGFVRNDLGHALLFFPTLGALALVLAADRRRRADTAALAVLGIAVVIAATNFRIDRLWSPIEGAQATWEQTLDVADGGERDRLRAEGVARIRAAHAIPADVLADVRPHPVHVFPVEASAVWANDLRWSPLPVFQGYAAYTASLGERNAERLADPGEGPARILVAAGGGQIEGRFVPFDQPGVTLGLLCRFRVSVVGAQWMSLARGRQRCSGARRIGRIRARWDEQIPVPAPGPSSIVVASVDGVQVSGVERLRTLAYKARDRYVTLGDVRGRFVPDLASGPVVLRSDGIDLPGPFSFVPQAQTITFGKAGGDKGGDLEVTFSEIRVDPTR